MFSSMFTMITRKQTASVSERANDAEMVICRDYDDGRGGDKGCTWRQMSFGQRLEVSDNYCVVESV